MASAAQSYVRGAEYEFPDGTKGVWSGKMFVTPDDYLRSKGQSQAQFDDKRALMDRIARAQGKVNIFSTGAIGGWTQDIPGSPAKSLAADLAPLQANEFISGTTDLRQNSPTGAGVGGQSDAEGRRLEGRNMSFDIGIPTKDMRYNLQALSDNYSRHTPGLTTQNPFTLTEDTRSQIPERAYFRAGDGKVYRQQKGAGFPGRTAPQALPRTQGAQRLTPEQAAALPPGTRFIGMDGVERVRQ